MLGQRDLRGRDAVKQAVIDHALCPVSGLLGGLEQRDQGAVPQAGLVSHQLGHAGQAGDVQVVAAGMRHRHLAAIGVLAGSGARIVRTGVFPDRQRVHVGPKQNGRPAAVSQHADHASAADARTHLVAAPLQPLCSAPGGPLLLMGQLRVLMQVLIELFLGIPQARVAGQDLIDTAHDHPPPRGAHALGLIIARSIQVGCLSPVGRRRAQPGARSRGGGTPRRQARRCRRSRTLRVRGHGHDRGAETYLPRPIV